MINKWWMPAIIVVVAIMISIQSWSNKLAVNPATDSNQGVSTSAPVTTNRDANVETITDHLKSTVSKLSDEIGARNLQHLTALNSAADFIDSKLNDSGYRTDRQTFQVDEKPCHNVIAELAGKSVPQKILIVGAHYDSCQTTPGANDNATGVAAMLEIADQLSQFPPDCSIRFVAWTNEEPPYFQRENQMGSLVHAASCQQKGEEIIGVIALETMGYYSDEAGSQKYPPLLAAMYPDKGNFIGFVANLQSAPLLRNTMQSFQKHTDFPCQQAALPELLQGVGWSDHWSYWQMGYQGLMVTDTAPFRYPHYHQDTDTIDKIDFDRLATVVQALVEVVKDLSAE